MGWFDPLARYRLAAELLAGAAVVIAAVWAFHDYSMGQQQIGYQRAQAEQAAVEKVRSEAQAKLDAQNNQRVADAEAKANERDTTQKALNAAVGVSADRLQRAIDQVRASANTDSVAALRTANTALTTVFQDCAAKYRTLGKDADGHASDVQTLTDAWPTAPPGSRPGKDETK